MSDEVRRIEAEIERLKGELVEARKAADPEPVQNYLLQWPDGAAIRLRDLFGDKRDMLLVHNMGQGCNYCTLWADGFIGFTPHLENRAAFVLASPDPPEVLQAFKTSRGWPFKCLSTEGTELAKDLGFLIDGNHWPGVSALHLQDDGTIVRVAKAFFGPGDDFCAIWPLFDLLKDGPAGWEPKLSYSQ